MSKSIKEKPVFKGAKTLTAAARVPKQIVRHASDSTKEKVSALSKNDSSEQTPQGYASDKLNQGIHEAKNRTKQVGGRVVDSVKRRIQKSAATNHEFSKKSGTYAENGRSHTKGDTAAKSIRRQTAKRSTAAVRQSTNRRMRATTKHAVSTAKQATKGTVKAAAKGSVKTAKRTIKTAKTAVKATAKTIKTAKAAAKVAAKTAKVATKAAMQAAKLAAKATIQAAKVAVKVTIAVIKAIIAAVKALIAAIVAGGWVAVLIIVIVAIIAAIICSVFGVFWSNEVAEDTPMTQAIVEIQEGFQGEIDKNIQQLSQATAHDQLKIIYTGGMDGDSDLANNWSDVIGIYSTVLTMGADYGTDAIIVTPEKWQVLKNIFYDMNKVKYSTATKVTTEKVIENGKEKEVETLMLHLYVEVESMTWEDAAKYYSFTEHQMQAITEMMSPAYDSMFAKLLGIDIYGGETPENIKDIISNLPANERAKIIIETAMSRLGDPYSQPKRGQGRYIDCSWLTYIAYKAAGINIPTTSVEQAKYCYDNNLMVGYNELQPGDLVFWSKTSCGCGRWNEIHHVAIYCGNGKIVEASSSLGKVVYRDLWGMGGGKWKVFGFGRVI